MVYEEVAYEKPETLINEIKALDTKRAEALLNLETMMATSLRGTKQSVN